MDKIKKASKSKELNFNLIVLVLTLFCSFLMIIATFTQLKVFSISEGSIKIMNYIPQVPTVLFIAGLLGKKYGSLSIIIYILTGLFLVPIFALGGGLDYILNSGFGYILGFIFAVFFASKIIFESNSLLRLTLANLAGVFTVHIFGCIYTVLLFLILKEPMVSALNMIINQSLNTLLIDLIFGFFAIILGNFVKTIFKKIS